MFWSAANPFPTYASSVLLILEELHRLSVLLSRQEGAPYWGVLRLLLAQVRLPAGRPKLLLWLLVPTPVGVTTKTPRHGVLAVPCLHGALEEAILRGVLAIPLPVQLGM